MRVVIAGAGGVGSLLGGLLSRAGVEVAFLARGRTLAALRERGLHVEAGAGTFDTPPLRAEADAAALGPADVVLVAVKAWQVKEIASSLSPLLRAGGFAVPLQNGVDARDTLAAALGEERVVGGLCHMVAFTSEPGSVKQLGTMLGVTAGEWRGGGSERLERLRATFAAASVPVQIAGNIRAALWEKALFVEPLGAVGAAIRLPVGAYRARPESRALLEEAMREIAALASAQGLPLGADTVAQALLRLDALPEDATASMQRDIQAGRPSELDDQTGSVLRHAQRLRVDAPLHRFLFGCLLPHELRARATAAA